METLNWPFSISLFANTSVAVLGLIFATMVTWKLYTTWGSLLRPARMGMFALVTLSWYIVVRVGYWSPTMWLSDIGGPDRYHSGWIQFRSISYAPAAVLGLVGLGLFMRSLFPWKLRTMILVFMIAIGSGLAVAATWQASELGYWFDRQAVIEWHDGLFGIE